MLVLATLLAACGAGGAAPGGNGEPPLAGAAIGGPFTLIDQNGKVRSDSEFAGQYRIVYFGYSYCPDVCPLDLQKLMRGLAKFEAADPARGSRVVPIFISVDPERDTPAVLQSFVSRFHPRLIGLTGTPQQIATVANEFAVFYSRTEGSAPDRYLVAHSQLAYLMDGDGKPLALLPLDDASTPDKDEGAPEAVAAALDRWVK